MSTYPMNVTSCYKCERFLAGGRYSCNLGGVPFVDYPTSEPLARYLVPCEVSWRNPDGMDIHCNSFVEHIKLTLF